jgi:hypothetical protein
MERKEPNRKTPDAKENWCKLRCLWNRGKKLTRKKHILSLLQGEKKTAHLKIFLWSFSPNSSFDSCFVEENP